MSSHLATGTKRRNSPAWCHAGMYGGILPFINGMPAQLNVHVNWKGHYSAGSWHVVENVKLTRSKTHALWHGESPIAYYCTHVEVRENTPVNGKAFVKVAIHHFETEITHWTWTFNMPPENAHWDIPWLTQRFGVGIDLAKVKIYG